MGKEREERERGRKRERGRGKTGEREREGAGRGGRVGMAIEGTNRRSEAGEEEEKSVYTT